MTISRHKRSIGERSARGIAALIWLICCLMAALPASAQFGTADPVPAATLLLPYFEVDLAHPDGITTSFAVRNASSEPITTNVTLWTDLDIKTLNFNLCIDADGVRTVNLRDIFNGNLPEGCEDGACVSLPPHPVTLQAAHTGQPAFAGLCAAVDHGDQIARGYLTLDVVNFCDDSAPDEAEYFTAGEGRIASDDNVIWGDYFLIDSLGDFAQGEAMVHLQADTSMIDSEPGSYTFYKRYSGGADNREPLGSNWQLRFIGGFSEGDHARVVCWRDSGLPQTPFACDDGEYPAPFPLGHSGITLFNQRGQSLPAIPPVPSPVTVLDGGIGILQQSPCPWAAGAVDVDGDTFPLIGQFFGSLCLDLNTATGSSMDPAKQSFVQALFEGFGRFSIAVPGVQLDNLTGGQPNLSCAGD